VILARSLENGGDRTFLVLGDERISHAQHHDQVMRMAAGLLSLGVQPGDRVAIAMRNLPEWSISFFAAALVGAVATPLNAFWNGPELAFGIEDCEPTVLVADGERFERLIGHDDVLHGVTLVGTRLDDRKTTERLPAPILPWERAARRLRSSTGDARPRARRHDALHLGTRATQGRRRHPSQHLSGHLRHRVRHRSQHGARGPSIRRPHRRPSR
jgi:acyl-CoA synthetase (AMP-forming)/AMP-acid ligase II